MLRGRPNIEKASATKLFADEVVPLFELGVIKPNIDRVFSVNEVVAAYNYLRSNESFGKVILEF